MKTNMENDFLQNIKKQSERTYEDVPDKYFDNLADNIWTEINTETPHQVGIESRPMMVARRKNYLPIMAAAASLTLAVGWGVWYFTAPKMESSIASSICDNSESPLACLAKVDIKEIESYVMDNIEEFDQDLVHESILENTPKPMQIQKEIEKLPELNEEEKEELLDEYLDEM
jgi:hypothetical protein